MTLTRVPSTVAIQDGKFVSWQFNRIDPPQFPYAVGQRNIACGKDPKF